MARYASRTDVASDRSRSAIEKLLMAHGATSFVYGWDASHDRMQFVLHERAIRFLLPRVTVDDLSRQKKRGRFQSPAAAGRALEQANRQRWRALYLVIRAKLEAVEAGIAIFDQEFLAFIMGRDGMTVGDLILPQLTTHGEWPGRALLGSGKDPR
jgi:hypothetical protein